MAKKASPVFRFDHSDPGMAKAQKSAQATFKYFWRELTWEYRRIIPALSLAAVKSAYSDNPSDPNSPIEHMWANDVFFDGVNITGTLINQPNELTSVQQGDSIELPFAQLGDWMYSHGDRVYGAYTVNLIRSKMSAGERRSHDNAWGLDFGDPNQIELIAPPDGAKKPGLLKKVFGGKSASQPVDLEADHPMSINMGPSLAEAIQKDPSFLQADDKGWTTLHSMALGGSVTGVKVLLECGADKSLKTPHGHTALQLAEGIGWKNVAALLR